MADEIPSSDHNRNQPSPTDKESVFITGIGGLIGSRIVRALGPNYRIIGTDLHPDNNPEFNKFDIHYLQSDLTDDASVRQAIEKARALSGGRLASVIHLAAYYDFTGEPSPLYEELTVQGTRRLLRHLHALDHVGQFVFSSSLLAMKPNNTPGTIREDDPLEGKWEYPQSKIQAEQAIRDEHGDIPAVILRISGVYDEAGHSLPIGQQMARIYEKQLESYFYPGNSSHGQSVVHLDDLADCFRRVVEHRSELGDYEVFLVAEPDYVSYGDLQNRLGELIHGDEWPTVRIPKIAAKAGAYVMDKFSSDDDQSFIKPWMIDLADDHYQPDITKARTVLGWEPKHHLGDTLPAIVQSLKSDPVQFYEDNYLPVTDEIRRKGKAAQAKR